MWRYVVAPVYNFMVWLYRAIWLLFGGGRRLQRQLGDAEGAEAGVPGADEQAGGDAAMMPRGSTSLLSSSGITLQPGTSRMSSRGLLLITPRQSNTVFDESEAIEVEILEPSTSRVSTGLLRLTPQQSSAIFQQPPPPPPPPPRQALPRRSPATRRQRSSTPRHDHFLRSRTRQSGEYQTPDSTPTQSPVRRRKYKKD